MKNRIGLLGIIGIVSIIGFWFAACGGDDDTGGSGGDDNTDRTRPPTTHTHTCSETWSSNTAQHWIECSSIGCDAKIETANHVPPNGVCATCGYDSHNHTWGSDVVTVPTCTIAGYTTQTCSDCQATQQIIPTAALQHDWNVESETVSEGVQGKKCNRMGCNEITDFNFTYGVGSDGPGGGKIIYVANGLEGRPLGFTVRGAGSFTAYYLEAAPTNQSTGTRWSSTNVSVTTGTAIGTGKANTAAILAEDANAPAAKVCADYRGGGKTDWFLPSIDELNEMYKAGTHIDISSVFFWSSSQLSYTYALYQSFASGIQSWNPKDYSYYAVRAVRAF